MQEWNAPSRDALTVAQVKRLVERAPFVDGGVDVLDGNLRAVRTVRGLRAGSVSRSFYADVHGTCSLQLDERLRWGLEYVRPWTEVYDNGLSARFDLGVYVLGTPRQVATGTLPTYDVTGLDLLSLLQREVAREFVVLAGTPVLQAVEETIGQSGVTVPVLLDSTARSVLIPDRGQGFGRVWPLVPTTADPDSTNTPVTWLRIVNDLLRFVGYRGLYCDPATGVYRSEPYRRPQDRAAEYSWTDAPQQGVAMGVERELIGQPVLPPTRWVVIANNPPEGVVPSEANGLIRTYDLPAAHPLSATNRNGLVHPKVYRLDAANPDALEALLRQQVQTDLSFTTRYEHTTRHFPLAGHADVYDYQDGELGASGKAQSIGHTIDLFGADTRWTWEAAA